MKRHSVIGVLKANYKDLQISLFLRVARLFIRKLRKELENEKNSVLSLLKLKKKHSTRCDAVIKPKFIQKIKQTINDN